MEHDRASALLARQFEEGPLATELQRELRDHVRQCADCKAEYDRLFEVERALEGGVAVPRASLERLSTSAPVRRAPALRRPHWSVRRRALSLLAAVAALLIAGLIADPFGDEEWGVRGGPKRAWISIFVLRDGGSVPMGATLQGEDMLLFAYTNLKGSLARHLAIAGRDSAGRVHWYHPAYRSAGERPSSLAVEEAVDRELPEAVRAEHAEGRLEICAFFSDGPLSIAELDRRFESGGWSSADGELVARDCREVTVR